MLFAEVDGAKHVLCALTMGTHEMAPLDLMFGLPQKVTNAKAIKIEFEREREHRTLHDIVSSNPVPSDYLRLSLV